LQQQQQDYESLTEKVGEELWLSVELDGDEDSVEKDEHDDEPVKHLRLDNVTNSEPSVTNDTAHVKVNVDLYSALL